ncbi:MAG: hypothetical protein GX437_08315 [Sphingobacteriales bacterium]|nr:hypothetical protein [Sphingobacteriales bacterium]
MKRKMLFLLVIALTGCKVSNYYQLYTTSPENGQLSASSISFEDENLLVSYNLWGVGGDFSFSIYNKSSEDAVIELSKSFYVMNGYANDYFKNRVYTKSTNTGVVSPLVTTPVAGSMSGYSTSYSENPELIIPPQTKKLVSEYTINSSYYDHCDLPKFPPRKNNHSLTFTKETSPFVFYNIITYSLNGIEKRIENHFFVSEIINLQQKDMVKLEEVKRCGKKTGLMTQVFTKASPEKFYIPYLNLSTPPKK